MNNDNEVKEKLKALLKECGKLSDLAQTPPTRQNFLSKDLIDNSLKSTIFRFYDSSEYYFNLFLYTSFFQKKLQQAICDLLKKYTLRISNQLTGEESEQHLILSDYELFIKSHGTKKSSVWKVLLFSTALHT